MIQWTDLNQLTPVMYDADTAPDGEKTLFMVRAITLSQRAEIIDRNQVFTDKDVRYCTTEVVDLVSYLTKRRSCMALLAQKRKPPVHKKTAQDNALSGLPSL